MRHGSRFLAGFVTTALLVTSCSNGGNPTIAQTPVSSIFPGVGVPKVEHPLDIAAAEKNPCGVLSSEEIESLGEKIRNSSTDYSPIGGLSCFWHLEGAGLIATVTPSAGHSVRGLTDVYAMRAYGVHPAFTPITISQYPAIISDTSSSSCYIMIGVRDDKTYGVHGDFGSESPNISEPCVATQKIGEFLIARLKQLQ